MLLGCDYHISVQSESDIPLPWQYPVITQRATCPIQCTVYLSHPQDISSLHVWIHPAGPLYLQIPTPSHNFQGKGTLRCTHFPYRCVVITNIALSSCVTMITSSETLTLEKSDPTQGCVTSNITLIIYPFHRCHGVDIPSPRDHRDYINIVASSATMSGAAFV